MNPKNLPAFNRNAVTRALQGHKGPSAPVDASDTLRSIQRAEIVDIIGEGVIGGLVNGLKSVYLDGVPVENADGSRNFADFAIHMHNGGVTGEAPHSFGDIATEVAVGVTILHAVPVVRTIADAGVDAVRITINVPALVLTKDNGDRVGASVEWKVEVQSNGGGYVERHRDTIEGKASSPYSRSVRIDLAATGPAPWDIRVTRITADSASVNLQDAIAWASYTALSGVRMLYKHSAKAQVTFDARNFTAVPVRGYDCFGVSDWDIPANYDPRARSVAGVWSGVFKQDWTNNPAWVIYNLVQQHRYGLGEYVTQLPDKWTLYELAQWCDAPVPDGRGGTEPRYVVHAYLQQQTEALRLLQDICAVFRGALLYSGGQLGVSWDAPGPVVASYVPANVVDGLFTYSDGSRGQKKSSCTCWFNDRTQFGKRMPATWDEPALIEKYGMRTMEIDPIGVASPGQAIRMAKWALFTTELEDNTVSFRIGADGQAGRIGQIFRITDPSEAGERLGGRVLAATVNQVTLDAPVTLLVGETYELWVTVADPADDTRLATVSAPVTNAPGAHTVLNVAPAYAVAPVAGTVWVLEANTVAPTLWRYLAITEVRNRDNAVEFEVTGLRHIPAKFDFIEANQPLTLSPTRRLSAVPVKPVVVSIDETVVIDGATRRIGAAISWVYPVAGQSYVLSWRIDSGPWDTTAPTTGNTIDLADLHIGLLEIQLRARNAQGQLSLPYTDTFPLDGLVNTPPNVTGMAYAIKPGQVVVTWTYYPGDLQLYRDTELRYGSSPAPADSVLLQQAKTNDYKHARPDNGTYLLWARHYDIYGNHSAGWTSLEVTVDDTIDSGGLQLLELRSTGFVFVFQAPGSIVSDSPSIQFEAVLVGLAGPASWAAEAFNAAGTSLGAVTLTGAGNFRELTSAEFVAAGTDALTCVVTASFGAFSQSATVTRFDTGSTGVLTRLTNENHILPADAAGVVTSYVGCGGTFETYKGATLLSDITTPSVVYSLAPGGNAGGLTYSLHASTGVYAVTTMPDALDVATLVMRATLSTGEVLDEIFGVVKSKAGAAGPVHYLSPLTEFVVPVDNAGNVVSVAGLNTHYIIARGASEEQATWSLSKVDTNCVSDLAGDKITLLSMATLGGVLSSVYTAVTPLPTGWGQCNCAVWCGDRWAILGTSAGAGNASVSGLATSPDLLTFTARNNVLTGAGGRWNNAAYGNGVLVAVARGNVTQGMHSFDKGVTWINSPTYSGAQNDWTHVTWGDKFFVTGNTSTQAASSPDGVNWTARTMPAVSCRPTWYGSVYWCAISAAGNVYLSTNGGVNWGAAVNATVMGGSAAGAGVYFRGVLNVAMAGASTKIYRHDGIGWGVLTTPAYRGVLQLYEIRGVLYLVDLDYRVLYTADGVTWKAGATLPVTAALALQVIIGHGGADIDYLPLIEPGTNRAARHLLGATSDSLGGIAVTASKLGETTVVKNIPVRKGSPPGVDVYAFSATPGSLVLPSTADGKVLDYTNNTITPTVLKNGLIDTPNWAISATSSDAGMVISVSGAGVVTVTSMADALDSALVNFKLNKAGQPEMPGPVGVIKSKGKDLSGFQVGTSFAAMSADSTQIALKFLGDGRFQLKRGPAGAYQQAAYWALPVDAAYAATSWVWIEQAGGDAVTSGLTAGFVPMTTDREVVLARVATGTYQADLRVTFATSAGGANAVVGGGALRLIVP